MLVPGHGGSPSARRHGRRHASDRPRGVPSTFSEFASSHSHSSVKIRGSEQARTVRRTGSRHLITVADQGGLGRPTTISPSASHAARSAPTLRAPPVSSSSLKPGQGQAFLVSSTSFHAAGLSDLRVPLERPDHHTIRYQASSTPVSGRLRRPLQFRPADERASPPHHLVIALRRSSTSSSMHASSPRRCVAPRASATIPSSSPPDVPPSAASSSSSTHRSPRCAATRRGLRLLDPSKDRDLRRRTAPGSAVPRTESRPGLGSEG